MCSARQDYEHVRGVWIIRISKDKGRQILGIHCPPEVLCVGVTTLTSSLIRRTSKKYYFYKIGN